MLRKRLIYMGIVPLLCCIRAGRKVRDNPAVPVWKNGRENLSKLYRKYRLRNGVMGQRAGKSAAKQWMWHLWRLVLRRSYKLALTVR